MEKEKCRKLEDLVPFFENEEYLFTKGESTWLQMAYNRINSDQESTACSVTYETTKDSTISTHATVLVEAFSVEAGKYESKVCVS